MAREICVLVTGVGGGGHGHEIVKALRLAERYYLIGVDMMESSFGLFDVDEAYTVPPASDPRYMDVLLDICQRRKAKVLIHGSEAELKVISRNRDELLKVGVLPLINTYEVIEQCMDKWATMVFLKEQGFPFPDSRLAHSERELPHDFPLPAVIKPAIGGGGSNNTFLVQDLDELEFACRYLVRQGKIALIQEYVGTPEDEYTVGVLSTSDGELIGSIALRRYILSGLSNRIQVPNRTGRTDLSLTLAISSGISQGIIDDYPEVRQACERIANALCSKGPLNIQCRFVAGKLYPFEINPRFSGTTYIRALMGFNEPDMLIRRQLLGEALPNPVRYKFGKVVRGLAERYVADFLTVTPDKRNLKTGRLDERLCSSRDDQQVRGKGEIKVNQNKRFFEKLLEVYESRAAFFLEKWERLLPFNEMLIDRWDKAKRLGFGKETSIYDSALVFGDVKVGKLTWIGPFTILEGSGGGIVIGDYCSISTGVQIYTHDSVKWAVSGGKLEYEKASTHIGNCVYVGPLSVIAKGVKIGDHCIIGAFSYVDKDIPDFSIVRGQPAKIVGRVILHENGEVECEYFNS